MVEELHNEGIPEIQLEFLKKNELTFDPKKNYQYIKIDDLETDTKLELITILESMNSMAYNYLKFIYDTYVEYLKEIITNGIVPGEILEEYKNNKFGFMIKVDKKVKKDQQLVFYCTKNQQVLKQFFLAKDLNGKKEDFNLNNIEIHSTTSKDSKKSTSSKESIKDIKDNKICNYIRGHMFEDEVLEYFKSKLNGAFEIPNVFYYVKKGAQNTTIFFNEFDGIFKVEKKITLNRGVVRINCMYSNDNNKEFFDCTKTELFELPGKSLVFIEVKKSPNYEGDFPQLFLKIDKYKNLIKDVYEISDYKILVLYFYNNLYISSKDYFEKFQKGISNSLKQGCGSYTVYSFYIYDNIYLYNKSESQKRLEQKLVQTQIELAQTKEKFISDQEKTQSTLNNVQNLLILLFKNIKPEVTRVDINNIISNLNLNTTGQNDNNEKEIDINYILNLLNLNPVGKK